MTTSRYSLREKYRNSDRFKNNKTSAMLFPELLQETFNKVWRELN